MNNVTTFDNFPPFATNGSRNMNTESAKYAVGFLEGETFPAEWANYLFHGATKGVSDLNTAVQSIWKENINVIQGSGQTPSPSDNTQLKTAIELMIQNAVLTANSQVLAQAKLDAHPVGSLYWSSDPTDPSILFGGTWTRIKDRFVLAVGDTYANGTTGGSATVKLTESNLPAHNHGGKTGNCGSLQHYHYTRGDTSVTDINHYHDLGTNGVTGQRNITEGMNQNSSGYMKNVAGWPYQGSSGVLSRTDTHAIGNLGQSGDDSVFTLSIDVSHQHLISGNTNWMSHNAAHSHSWGGWSEVACLETTNGTVTDLNHTHTIASVGSGTAHENMPPYIVKFCWERIS